MASKFLGSGAELLHHVSGPTEADRHDFEECDEDELRTSTMSLGAAQRSTLDDHDWRIDSRGTLRVIPGVKVFDRSDSEPTVVFKKTKVPLGTKLTPLGEMECGICLCDIEASELVEMPSCGHRYCSTCFSAYLDVETGDISNIEHTLSHVEFSDTGSAHLRIKETCGVPCPHPTCTSIVEGDHLKSWMSEKTWQRFERLSTQIHIQRLLRRGELVMCPEKCGNVMQGCACSDPICREQKLERETRRRLRYEHSMMRLWSRSAGARPCPHCKTTIEKNGGCDHMFCTACNKRFNWSDARPFK